MYSCRKNSHQTVFKQFFLQVSINLYTKIKHGTRLKWRHFKEDYIIGKQV
jgi:hypothetical protein